ncbi:MAG: hypothetical protein ACREFW_09375 [Rhizomicrobium sp.]
MAKKKLLEDVKARPARFYRAPGDVMRDRRFDDPERLAILEAWDAQGDPELAARIGEAIEEARRRLELTAE